MNPIFARRNRSAALSSVCQQNGRVGSSPATTTSASPSRNSGCSGVEPLSPPLSPQEVYAKPKLKTGTGSSSGANVVSSSINYRHHNNKGGTASVSRSTGTGSSRQTLNSFVAQNQNQNQLVYRKETMSIPENILTSKQNVLAQVSLTPEENHDRQNSPNSTPVGSLMVGNDLFISNAIEGFTPEAELEVSSLVPSLDDGTNHDDGDDDEVHGDEEREELKMFKRDVNKKFSIADETTRGKNFDSSNSEGVGMTLCDIEDEDFELGNHESLGDDQVGATHFRSFSSTSYRERDNSNFYQISSQQQQLPSKHQQGHQGHALHLGKPLRNHGHGYGQGHSYGFVDVKPIVKTLDGRAWRDLKMIVVGPNGILHEGWLGQGFTFDHSIPYGLVQKRGGPCGVLAVVQALVLRNLMFGSPFCDDDDLPVAEAITNKTNDPSLTRILSIRRTKALICALTEIIWRCGTIRTREQHGSSLVWSDSSDLKLTDVEKSNENVDGATVCFSGASAGAEIRIFHQADQLKNFIHVNLQKLDCVSLVYSAVLSRGIETIQEDFDFPNSPLLGSHGYCSQELVNLLTIGKAISNVFDNQVTLDDKILKGIEGRCDIGLLSLFEHYDSCRVGNFLKNPTYPLWIICSESHFSVLFSTNLALTSDPTIEKFDLFYYDGLGRQQNTIKLTIELINESDTGDGFTRTNRKMRIQAGSSATTFNNNNNNNDCDVDEELVPPIEKCIRTKWKNAVVDWNDTEPIL